MPSEIQSDPSSLLTRLLVIRDDLELLVRWKSETESSGTAVNDVTWPVFRLLQQGADRGALCQFALNMAGVQEVQPLRGGRLLLRSDSNPVSRGERPNSSRKGLLILASRARSNARLPE